jgi:hypothetical protein
MDCLFTSMFALRCSPCPAHAPTHVQIPTTLTVMTGAGSNDAEGLTPATAAATLTVTGCNRPVDVNLGPFKLQTTLTWSWSHAIKLMGPSTVTVPWSGSATVPASASFTRTVSSSSFLLDGMIQASMNITHLHDEHGTPSTIYFFKQGAGADGRLMMRCSALLDMS